MLEMLAANYARSRQRSGESKIQSIKDQLFSKFDDLRRDIFVSCFNDKLPHVVR